MEHKTDNFDALWDRLKQAVRERREPAMVKTMAHLPFHPYDADMNTSGVRGDVVHLSLRSDKAHIQCDATRDDLINIAEHCILRAAQFENQ